MGLKLGVPHHPGFLSVNYDPLIVMAGGLPWLNKGLDWKDSDVMLCSPALIF